MGRGEGWDLFGGREGFCGRSELLGRSLEVDWKGERRKGWPYWLVG
jgi:hypothetical protein